MNIVYDPNGWFGAPGFRCEDCKRIVANSDQATSMGLRELGELGDQHTLTCDANRVSR